MHEQLVEDCAKFGTQIAKSLEEKGRYGQNLENKSIKVTPHNHWSVQNFMGKTCTTGFTFSSDLRSVSFWTAEKMQSVGKKY